MPNSPQTRAEQLAKEIVDEVFFHSDPEVAGRKIADTLLTEAHAAFLAGAAAQRKEDVKLAAGWAVAEIIRITPLVTEPP